MAEHEVTAVGMQHGADPAAARDLHLGIASPQRRARLEVPRDQLSVAMLGDRIRAEHAEVVHAIAEYLESPALFEIPHLELSALEIPVDHASTIREHAEGPAEPVGRHERALAPQ